MGKSILYFAHWCPDIKPFVAGLQRLDIEYGAVDITSSGSELKSFLKLRNSLKIQK